MSRKFLYLLIFVLFILPAFAQTIKGNITSTEGDALGNISVRLEGINNGGRTSENGDLLYTM